MDIQTTTIFALILGLWLLILSFRVIALRGGPGAFLISKKNKPVSDEVLSRAIRGHGNLTEYAPFFLLLMLIAELNQAAEIELMAAGVVFTLGRLSHGMTFAFLKHNMLLRVGGMVLTFTGFLILLKLLASILMKM